MARSTRRGQLEGLLPVNDPANPLDTRINTELPGLKVMAAWETATKQLPLDTVHIDLDAGQVHLVWRATLEQSLGIEQLHLRLEKI